MNKFKKFLILGIGLVFLAMSVILVSCKKGEEETQIASQENQAKKEILYYTCGMHPSVRVSPEDYEKGNKNCPVCNMGLVPVYKEEVEGIEMGAEEREVHEGVGILVKLSPEAQALSSVRTEEIQYLPLFKEIYTVGQMDYDERKVAYVAAWITGRIDKLFVDFTGVNVKKGEPLVWIYSPDLVTTQQEYLLALETLEKVKDQRKTDRGIESEEKDKYPYDYICSSRRNGYPQECPGRKVCERGRKPV